MFQNGFLTEFFIRNCWQQHSMLNKSNRALMAQADQKEWQLYQFQMAANGHLEFQPSEEFRRHP